MTRILILPLLALLGLSACNTVEGVGQDIQSGGQAIEETADDAQASL